MSLYQTVFPTSSPPPVSERSLPSSVSSTYPKPTTSYLQDLASTHSALAGLPDELSAESSPISEANVKLIRERLAEVLRHANYDTSSARWTHVTRSLRMVCTSRRYVGVAKGVVVGEKHEVSSGDYKWVLPETEEEWEQCERRWEKRSVKPPSGEGRPSKYFANSAGPSNTHGGQINSSKAEQVRDKVKKWQAKVVPDVEPLASQQTDAPRASPLPFPVAKHTAIASMSKPPGASNLSKAKAATPSPALPGPSEDGPHAYAAVSAPDPEVIEITDLSEMYYLPPSFPTHLVTSTPPRGTREKPTRAKPSPIPHRIRTSPPSSSPGQLISNLERIEVPLASSSSLPVIISSPPQQPRKRIRPITPPADDDDETPASRLSGSKKARTDAADRVSSAPLPPSSTPPPPATPPETPPIVLTGKGLGNAKGLPISSTPFKRNVPTLTDLLASSRRSKPRPRPPSRKSKSRGTTPALISAQKDELPVLSTGQDVRDASPAPSAPRTLLSSPASGSSSDSEEPMPTRSPVSPLFTQNVSAFAPPFVSTQAGVSDAPELSWRSIGGVAA
ncbi:hypothetical protein NM688_g3680 [Phlebia brevispora]|uniref:Uncharacterized protein n=1 Tax=Phlebia brevispora TaxID=194682 RepID=A0ACC1T5Q9_9APHY|nr:hypothetical protein NM688_g3680 [Phlebia brevispora]